MAQSPAATLHIDPASAFQTVRGFGASGAWWAQDIGGWQDDVNRQRMIDLLFDTETGIGLSIYRYNIGGGTTDNDIIDPWRSAETFEVEAGVYDWTRDANAMWVLRAVRNAGVEQFIVFANSPAGRMTHSGKANGGIDGESNLRDDMVDDFAQYLVDITRHLREDEGIPVGWISPINEPQWDWQPSKGQEGCHYTTGEILAVVQALLKTIEEIGLDVEVSAPEAGEWKFANFYVDTLFQNDPATAAQLDHFAVHSYWSEPEDKARLTRYITENYPDIEIWMTEWTEMQMGRDYGMESAMVLANVVHDDLTIGSVTSWQYWIAVSKYNFRDGLIYTDPYRENIRETKRLWALGNFSRFIRPGAVRIEATSDHEDLRITAYRSADDSALIAVIINNGDNPVAASIDLSGAFHTVDVYETSEQHDLARTYNGDSLSETIFAAQSVTTLVYHQGE